MPAPKHYDVIVVGYGPVGSSFAALVAGGGHQVLILEATDLSKASPRAINMDNQSMATICQDIGLGEAWERTTMRFPGGNFVTGYPDPKWLGIGPLSEDKENPIFGPIKIEKGRAGYYDVVFYQPELERQLHAKVESMSNITVLLQRKVTKYEEIQGGKAVRVTCKTTKTEWQRTAGGEWIPADVYAGPVEEFTFTCSYLVGCDGAKSTVRYLMFADSPSSCMNFMANFAMQVIDKAVEATQGELTKDHTKNRRADKLVSSLYEETWLVIDVLLLDESLIGTKLPHAAQQICDSERPCTIVPGSWVWDETMLTADGKPPGRHYRWEFLLDLKSDDPLALVEDAAVFELLKPWVTPEQVTVVRSATYVARPSDAIQWQRGRVLLCGDSAHTTPPFLGQGLNQGLRDASNLSWKLDFNLKQLGGQRLLDTYARERRPISSHMTVGACDVGNKITVFANAIKEGPEAVEAAKAKFVDQENPATYGHKGGKWGDPATPAMGGPLRFVPKAGSRDDCPYTGLVMPQPEVTVDGKTSRLYELLGRGFALIYNGDLGQAAVCSAAAAERLASIDGRLVAIKPSENGGKDKCLVGLFQDFDAVLVRPDHHAYGVAKGGAEVDEMMEGLQKFLGQKGDDLHTDSATDGPTSQEVRIVYTGDIAELCQAISSTIARLAGHPGVVITVGIDAPTAKVGHALDNLRALRRLLRLCPYAVLCHIQTQTLTPLDVLVALSCDVVESAFSELKVTDGEAVAMARRYWRLFTGKFPPKNEPWKSDDLLHPNRSLEGTVRGYLPCFWMALRCSGMAQMVGGGGNAEEEDETESPAAKLDLRAEQQAAMKTSSFAFNFYFGPKVACLFTAWDAVSGREGYSTTWTAMSSAALTVCNEESGAGTDVAVRCKRESLNTFAITLTSDIALMPVAEIEAKLSTVLADALVERLNVTLKDGKVASSFSIFPRNAGNHYDMYKWHRGWEQFVAKLGKRRAVTCTAEGRELCPPLMELFFSASVRIWASPDPFVRWCQRPFAYTPGPAAMQGALSKLTVAQLRLLLLGGVPLSTATAWKLVTGAEADKPGIAAVSRQPSVRRATTTAISPSLARQGSLDSEKTPQAKKDTFWAYGGGLLGGHDDVLPQSHTRPVVATGCCSMLGYGLALPGEEHKWTQAQIANMLGIEKCHKFYPVMVASHIKTRYLAELERDLADPSTVGLKRLQEKHLKWGSDMLSRAIKKACMDADITPRDLNHIVVAGSTGFTLPGLTAYCLADKELGIPQGVSREDIVGMGCHAGLNSLKAAAAWAVANPGRYAVACGVEVMSAQYVWGAETRKKLNNIICNSLFGDGCFAAVFRSHPQGEGSPPPAYLDMPPAWWAQMCDTAALTDMIYNVEESEGKFRFDLSELAPYHVGQGLFTLMHFALYASIPVHYAEHVVTHTGGQTVLDCSSIALGLEGRPKECLPYTVKALRDFGNQSSASFIFAFDKLVKSGNVRRSDTGLFVTMGPGAGLEMALWTAGERFEARKDVSLPKVWRSPVLPQGRRQSFWGSIAENRSALVETLRAGRRASTQAPPAAWETVLVERKERDEKAEDSSSSGLSDVDDETESLDPPTTSPYKTPTGAEKLAKDTGSRFGFVPAARLEEKPAEEAEAAAQPAEPSAPASGPLDAFRAQVQGLLQGLTQAEIQERLAIMQELAKQAAAA